MRLDQGQQEGVFKSGAEHDGVIPLAVDMPGEAFFKGARVPQEGVRAGSGAGGEQRGAGDQPVRRGTPYLLVKTHFMVEKAYPVQVQPVRVFQRGLSQAVHAEVMFPGQRVHDARQHAGDSPHAETFPGDETDLHE